MVPDPPIAPDRLTQEHLPLHVRTRQALSVQSLAYVFVPLLLTVRYPLKDEDIAHLWPTRYAHINPYGRYTIDVDGDLPEAGDGLRPLRPA